jgi:hypothetical protein
VSPPDVRHAGVNFGQTHYSASLLKVAAMYAAYELRSTVNNVARSTGAASAAELFERLAPLDDLIDVAVPDLLTTPGLTRAMRVPKYAQIFSVIPLVDGGVAADFSHAFEQHLRLAIIESSNASAAFCIKALGYSWINGALASGGFFFPGTRDGIWLAGTFAGDQPYARIPSINDEGVAQATTTFDMTNLYAHLLGRSLVVDGTGESSDRMLDLLAETHAGPEPSWMDGSRENPLRVGPVAITHTKIGVGPLKTGPNVFSEGSIVTHHGTGRQFIVVWQNVLGGSIPAVTFVVEQTIVAFCAIP